MSLSKLDSISSVPRTPSQETKKRKLHPWLLPASLVVALALIFAWLLRDRLIPSLDVRAVPVVILEDIEGVDARLLSDRSEATGEGQVPDAEFSAPMQFQAAGWFEPDPLPIRATALIDGVVEEVHVLEGASVSKGVRSRASSPMMSSCGCWPPSGISQRSRPSTTCTSP